jgi:hypothetical protein
MKSGKYLCIILVISLAACSQVNIMPTSEMTPAAKVVTENPCDTFSMEQPIKPAFKGMELYSWQESKNGIWVFSILYGTNRNKTVREVKSFALDLSEVEKCFCDMPENETVVWMTSAQEETSGAQFNFPQPSDAIVDEVEQHAVKCRIDLITYAVHNNAKNEQ